eukprot:TRINITY_DN3266_c0_g1_i2.p1 TRINITY_DN3266_c0_g1~~TRINITY_DN3266_c0_g1_i2.p1  ORF type:complete len:469 (-),score=123.50 TRINITY_DN3266_c0_g1_i2:82-1488(-)
MFSNFNLPIFLLAIALQLAYAQVPKTPEESLKLGDQAFLNRKYEEAENFYSDAIMSDSNNYMAFFKRASVYVERRKYREALQDLTQSLSNNPQYYRAYVRRAKVHLDLGNFKQAKIDLDTFLAAKPGDKEATKLLTSLEEANSLYARIREQTDLKTKNDLIEKLLDISPLMSEARLTKADIQFQNKIYQSVLELTAAIIKFDFRNVAAILLRGKAIKRIGDEKTALNHFKLCSQYESESKECKMEYEALENFLKDFEEAKNLVETNPAESLKLLESCFKYDPDWDVINIQLYLVRCKAYLKLERAGEAERACSRVIEMDESNVDGWINRAEAKILIEDYEAAIRDYEKANELSRNNGNIQEGLNRARRLLKMSQRKDYYKILGLPKTATVKEVRKAYRTLALQYHPDKNPDNKDVATARFKDISEAYGVLADEEKKGKYDRGEDLEERPGGFQNPFHGGFQHFTFQWR